MSDFDEFMSKPEPEVYSTDERIEAIFHAARDFGWGPGTERALSDAIDEAMSHAYAEGRADERKEYVERAMRALNETGQGEHGVSLVTEIERIWNMTPRRAA
jgi:hypothetical protein